VRERKRVVKSERGSRLCAKVTTARGAVRHIAETGREPSLPEEVLRRKESEREREREGGKKERERERKKENETRRKNGRER
jgi:hypothetical protein